MSGYRIVDAGVRGIHRRRCSVDRAFGILSATLSASRHPAELALWPADGTVNESHPCGALNSAVECHLHTVEVVGSNPAAPTIKSTT